MRIPLGYNAYRRTVAREPEVKVVNRYFEKDPTNLVEQAALICRPALKKFLAVGEGPIRAMFQQDGSFSNDLFIVSDTKLYYVPIIDPLTETWAATQITGTISGSGTVSICATDTYLFIADGFTLQYWDGSGGLQAITTPDDVGIVSVGQIAGYVICVVAESDRFYWIQPGAVTIDALDFATAERSPDPVLNVTVINDQFWLFGTETTEVWYPTGDADAPFQRIQGRLFDQGIIEGTAIKMRDKVVVVGADGIVYAVTSGPVRVSTNGIEERIRTAMQTLASQGAS